MMDNIGETDWKVNLASVCSSIEIGMKYYYTVETRKVALE